MSFRVQGLEPREFMPLYGLSDGELAQAGAQRFSVNAKPGFPDRVEVRDLDIGEAAILLNYEHQPADTPYRSRHAIFVREATRLGSFEPERVPERGKRHESPGRLALGQCGWPLVSRSTHSVAAPALPTPQHGRGLRRSAPIDCERSQSC